MPRAADEIEATITGDMTLMELSIRDRRGTQRGENTAAEHAEIRQQLGRCFWSMVMGESPPANTLLSWRASVDVPRRDQ